MPVKGLTPEEVAARTFEQVQNSVKSTSKAARLEGETQSEANERLTAAYKQLQARPILSPEMEEGGANVQWTRQAAGGIGEYVITVPPGYSGPEITKDFGPGIVRPDLVRTQVTTAGITPNTVVPTGVAGYSAASGAFGTAKTPEQIAAYESAKSLAQSFVSAYGGKLSDYFDATTGKVTSPTKTAIATALGSNPIVPNGNPAVVPPVVPAGSTVVPGSGALSTTSTEGLASDVFKNTLAIFFGPAEMSKPWVNQLYKTVSGFTRSGSTPEEAFNMAVLESENKPEMADFVKRFKGIYALQKMKQSGKAVTVPTVAEYFATETKMGDILKSSNLGDLANEDFLGDVLSKGVSATEFGNRITAIFDRIDTAPDVVKKTVGRYFPTLDRTQLAKALALGDKGAKQLEQELAGYEVLAGAGAQGLEASTALPGGITLEQAQQIAKGGGTYASTLGQFGQIAGARETEQKLAEISGVKSIGVTGLTSAVISKSAAELKKLEDLTKQEEARFSAKAGTIGSKSLASQSRANRVI